MRASGTGPVRAMRPRSAISAASSRPPAHRPPCCVCSKRRPEGARAQEGHERHTGPECRGGGRRLVAAMLGTKVPLEAEGVRLRRRRRVRTAGGAGGPPGRHPCPPPRGRAVPGDEGRTGYRMDGPAPLASGFEAGHRPPAERGPGALPARPVLERGLRPRAAADGDRKPWNTTGISTPSSSATKGGG